MWCWRLVGIPIGLAQSFKSYNIRSLLIIPASNLSSNVQWTMFMQNKEKLWHTWRLKYPFIWLWHLKKIICRLFKCYHIVLMIWKEKCEQLKFFWAEAFSCWSFFEPKLFVLKLFEPKLFWAEAFLSQSFSGLYTF